MPDTAADALLNVFCKSLLFLLSQSAIMLVKYLFTASGGNRAKCCPDDFQDLFDLVWERGAQAGC